jgi:hypothetical protein
MATQVAADPDERWGGTRRTYGRRQGAPSRAGRLRVHVARMGRKSKKNKERGTPIPALAPLAGAASPPQAASGYYQPARDGDTALPRKAGARLLPLQRAGGLQGLDRPAPQPRQPPETLVRRAATTTPSSTRNDDSEAAALRQQLMERDATINALKGTIKELEKQKASPAAAAAAEVAELKSRLQATNEGFVAAENVIKQQEEQIKSLQDQLHAARGGGGEQQDMSPAEEGSPAREAPRGAREIAAAHAAQGLLWIDPWVTRGERIDGVKEMCATNTHAPRCTRCQRNLTSRVARQGMQPSAASVQPLRCLATALHCTVLLLDLLCMTHPGLACRCFCLRQVYSGRQTSASRSCAAVKAGAVHWPRQPEGADRILGVCEGERDTGVLPRFHCRGHQEAVRGPHSNI